MTQENPSAVWRALQARANETRAVPLRALRDGDAARGSRFAREALGLFFDFSRQRIDSDGLRLLTSLADADATLTWANIVPTFESRRNGETRVST